jgi:lambda repressor-like predicted transcriptional regulator
MVDQYKNINKKDIKSNAIKLRRLGYSYALISQKTNIAKSTLNYWLKNIPYKPNRIVKKRIEESVDKSSKILHQRKVLRDKIAFDIGFREVGKITKRDLFMIGLGLYIGEGTKNKTQMVRIVNSDPKVIKLAISWLKKIFNITKKNLRVSVHMYPDMNLEETLNFWSKTTKIPLSQFRKTQIDRRLNKSAKNLKKLKYGTVQITVFSGGDSKKGVYLFHRILGNIESIYKRV